MNEGFNFPVSSHDPTWVKLLMRDTKNGVVIVKKAGPKQIPQINKMYISQREVLNFPEDENYIQSNQT